jgi:hypothetical protein
MPIFIVFSGKLNGFSNAGKCWDFDSLKVVKQSGFTSLGSGLPLESEYLAKTNRLSLTKKLIEDISLLRGLPRGMTPRDFVGRNIEVAVVHQTYDFTNKKGEQISGNNFYITELTKYT